MIRSKKGIFYTFMALLLLLAVLGLQNVASNQQQGIQENSIMNDAFAVVNNRFNNILLDVVIIGKNGAAKEVQERILPFSYDLDGNSLTFASELPMNIATIEYYFSSINGYEVFATDTNYSNIYDGLNTDVNTIQNSNWAGAADKLDFYISPQCLNYYAEGLTTAGFEAGSCSNGFDINSVERFDVNVNIRPGLGEDYNAVLCNIDGFAGCPSQAYDSLNSLPYFELSINDGPCSDCIILPSLKNIKGHYNPYEDNDITIFCNPLDNNCVSSPIQINLGQAPTATHSGNVVDVVMKVDFTSKIHYLYFADFNVAVENEIFEIRRRTTNN